MLGDHIRTLRAGRWTHAIDCGDETVIVLADDAEQARRVRRSYRPEFVAGADTVEIVRHRERTFPAEEVVARAYSRFSDPALASMFRDSEAFAEWCTTGRLPNGPPNVAVSAPGVAAPAKPAPPRGRQAPAKASRSASKPGKPAAKAKSAARASAPRAGRTARKAKPGRRVKASPRKRASPAARGAGRTGARKGAKPGARRAKVARR